MATLSGSLANELADTVTPRMNGGELRIFDGTKLLARLRFPDPAFSRAQGGVAISGPLRGGRVEQDGLARGFSITDRTGNLLATGSVGTTRRSDMVLSQRALQRGADVTIASCRYIQESQ